MEGMELISFKIISSVGTARSYFIEAIDLASEGKFEEAQKAIADGEEAFTGGHEAHAELLQKMANGEMPNPDLLLTHAEDQLMAAESFKILAEKFITLYKKINK